MMDEPPHHDPQRAIMRFDGQPKEPFKKGERRRWEVFRRSIRAWFGRKATMADDLAEQIACAEADKRSAEAEKAKAEAADAAERAEAQRLGNVRTLCDLADEVFKNSPDEATVFKLAVLQQRLPDVAEQVALIKTIMQSLKQKRGTEVAFKFMFPIPFDDKQPPGGAEHAGETGSTGDRTAEGERSSAEGA